MVTRRGSPDSDHFLEFLIRSHVEARHFIEQPRQAGWRRACAFLAAASSSSPPAAPVTGGRHICFGWKAQNAEKEILMSAIDLVFDEGGAKGMVFVGAL